MNWLHYLLEANLYLGIFYACYCLFLKRETHYTLNRVYLLFSCLVSFVLPLMQLGALKPVVVTGAATITGLPGNVMYSAPVQINPVIAVSHLTWQDGILYFYLLGVGLSILLLAIKLYKLWVISRVERVNCGGYKLIRIEGSGTAFSFFNHLFLGTNAPRPETMIEHELVHIRQRHSADILFMELFKIINWFNPLSCLLQNSLKTVHEYIADEQTAAAGRDKLNYSSFLVDNAYGVSGPAITHSFFNYNLLKKRIIMLNQKRSGRLTRLKYLIAAPLCAGLLCISTIGFSKTYGWIDLAPAHTLKVVPVTTITNVDTTKHKPLNLAITPKGYYYWDEVFKINNKEDYRVVIQGKNGVEKEYFKNSATHAQIKLLKEKYGYTFPSMAIYGKLPPAPHVPIAKKTPSVAPKPDQAKSTQDDANNKGYQLLNAEVVKFTADKLTATGNSSGRSDNSSTEKKSRLIVLDDVPYNLKVPLKPGQQLYFTAEDSTVYIGGGNKAAIAKWGSDAENGVVALYGHPTVTIK